MSHKIHDYIVVGSGPTGAMVAQTLLEAGKQVTMLDVGVTNRGNITHIPDKDFVSLRETDPEQYKYLLGGDLEGVAWGKVGKGEQVTPPRKHIMSQVDEFLPTTSEQFSPFESLGYGGLGIGWGLGCWEWSDSELRAAGMNPVQMHEAYNIVSKRIGISATKDSAADYTIRGLKHYQSSADMDDNHTRIYKKYLKFEARFRKAGFVMGRAPLALLTQDLGSRKKYSYKEMDFYSDDEKSAYRPWITVDELKKNPNFTYIHHQLVLSFTEDKGGVIVHCLDISSERNKEFRAKKLVLTAGILGTARIVLRSMKTPNAKLPILCNPYSYIPCIQPSMVGKAAERHKLGFAQLSFFLDEEGDNFGAAMASLYSYQSLMLFRMIRQVPLNFSDARIVMQYLSSGLVIMGIHQPDTPSKYKYLCLQENPKSPTGDSLKIVYQSSSQELKERERREKKYIKAMRSMGVYAIKRIDPGIGASIHYAGALPFSEESKPYTINARGRLNGTRQVYVADGSGFTYLAAKGLTFTLMANAHRIAKGLL